MSRECFGKFNDGKTATPRNVRLVLDPPVLDIRDEDGARIEAWPLKDIQIVGEIFEGSPVRLKRGAAGQSRVQFEHSVFFTALTAALPHLSQNPNLRWRGILISAAAIAALFAAVFFALPHATRWAAKGVPVSWEERIGEEAQEQVISMFGSGAGYCSSLPGDAALNKLSARLLAHIDMPYDLDIRVVNIGQVNAFAMLGGHIVLFDGLLQNAASADEVAGVLAHEIGHLAERHPTQGIIQATGLSILFDIFFGDSSSVAGLAQTMMTLSHTRDAEREADRIALRLLRGANISPAGMANFFDRLAEIESDNGPLSLLSTHPDSKERAAAVRDANQKGNPAMTDKEWRDLKAICG